MNNTNFKKYIESIKKDPQFRWECIKLDISEFVLGIFNWVRKTIKKKRSSNE